MRPAATYSPNAEIGVSTIGPKELNCRVRNGNGCDLFGITTDLIPVCCFCERTFSRTVRFSGDRRRYTRTVDMKTKAANAFTSSGLKNMAKPHGRLVLVS